MNDGGVGETDASDIESVEGLGTVIKTVNGENKTFDSAFESTGGVQTISGLPDGTYRLYESVVPPGYISTYRYIQFTVENRVIKDVKTDTGEDADFIQASGNSLALLKVTNEAGVALPSTGGPGTRSFTILGSLLILAAGILLWRKRRAA